MTTKTHYRKAFDSPYLSAADIVDPVVLTVRSGGLELDKTKKTKEFFNTIYFVENEIRQGEKLKPMILNATNSKMMARLSSSPFVEDWVNIKITVYVDKNVRFGRDTVEGLRIRKADQSPTQTTQAQKKPSCSDDDFNKMIKLIQDGSEVGGAPMTTDRLRKGRELTEMQLEFLAKLDSKNETTD